MAEGLRMPTAWDTVDERFVAIRNGEADILRPDCHSGRLVCPIPNCGAREITSRREYRLGNDTWVAAGFRHQRLPEGGEHSPESLRHQAGKAAVADWLRGLGFERVSVERTVRTAHQPDRPKRTAARRRPDVLGTHPDGQKIAVEVQVSPLGEHEWRQRTDDLRSAGYRVLWLWAWETRQDGETAASTTALRGSAFAGADVWFLDPGDPERRPRLGWGHQKRTVGGEEFTLRPFDLSRTLLVDWSSMGEHALAADATVVRDTEMVDDVRLAAAQARQAKTRADAERRQAAKDAERAEVRSVQLEAQRQERRLATIRAAEPWAEQTGLPVEVLAVCFEDGLADAHVYVPGLQWKAALVMRLFDRDRLPAVLRRSAVVAWLKQTYPCDDGVGRAVGHLLRRLQAVGAVRLDGGSIVVKDRHDEASK